MEPDGALDEINPRKVVLPKGLVRLDLRRRTIRWWKVTDSGTLAAVNGRSLPSMNQRSQKCWRAHLKSIGEAGGVMRPNVVEGGDGWVSALAPSSTTSRVAMIASHHEPTDVHVMWMVFDEADPRFGDRSQRTAMEVRGAGCDERCAMVVLSKLEEGPTAVFLSSSGDDVVDLRGFLSHAATVAATAMAVLTPLSDIGAWLYDNGAHVADDDLTDLADLADMADLDDDPLLFDDDDSHCDDDGIGDEGWGYPSDPIFGSAQELLDHLDTSALFNTGMSLLGHVADRYQTLESELEAARRDRPALLSTLSQLNDRVVALSGELDRLRAAGTQPANALADISASAETEELQRVVAELRVRIAEVEELLNVAAARRRRAETDVSNSQLRVGELERALEKERRRADIAEDRLPETRRLLLERDAELARLRAVPAVRPAADVAVPEVDRSFKSAAAAVRAAAADFPLLVFHPRVWSELERFEFPNPTQMYLDLAALSLVAARWSADPVLGGSLVDAAASAGVPKFRMHVSETAQAAEPAEYQVTVDGVERPLGPHFGRGAKSAANCYRAYLWLDTARRRIVVGHVGRHLPDSTYSN